jgi:hypothetical protein
MRQSANNRMQSSNPSWQTLLCDAFAIVLAAVVIVFFEGRVEPYLTVIASAGNIGKQVSAVEALMLLVVVTMVVVAEVYKYGRRILAGREPRRKVNREPGEFGRTVLVFVCAMFGSVVLLMMCKLL